MRAVDPRDNLLRANELAAAGRFDEAEREYLMALAARPDNPAFHLFHGRALLDQGRIDEAVARFDRALALSPANDLAHALRGLALLERGDRAGIEAVDRHGDPGDPAFAARLLLFLESRLPELYHPPVPDTAITEDVPVPAKADPRPPAKPGAWRSFLLRRTFHRALARRRDYRLADALAGLFRVLEAFPDDADALVEAAEVYYLLRRWDDALRLLDRIGTDDRDRPEAKALRGLVLYASGKRAEAEPLVLAAIGGTVNVQATDEAIDLAPFSMAFYYAGRIALAKGDRVGARTRFAKLPELDPELVSARWEEWKTLTVALP